MVQNKTTIKKKLITLIIGSKTESNRLHRSVKRVRGGAVNKFKMGGDAAY